MFGLIPYGREENSLFNYLDNFERNFFGSAFSNVRQFRTDIVDKGDKYQLCAELPGFSREDIKIDLKDGILTISAKKDESVEENKDSFIRRERRYGSFSRSFDISGIDADAISAAYRDGVLTLDLPKTQPEPVPPARQIEIK